MSTTKYILLGEGGGEKTFVFISTDFVLLIRVVVALLALAGTLGGGGDGRGARLQLPGRVMVTRLQLVRLAPLNMDKYD